MRYIIKSSIIVIAVFFASSARAQENWARLSFTPELISAIPAPDPSRPEAGLCAALPAALAAPDSGAFDAQTIPCLDSLLAVPDYVSPSAASPVAPQLTQEEKTALDKYVDSYAYLVNAALRQGADVSKYRKYIQTLNSALGKLPAYRGVTFRGSAYPPVPEEKLRPGAVLTDPAFLSTSRNRAVAESYTGAAGYLSVILSKTGRQVSYNDFLNGLESEMEVLFPTNTKLRIIAVSGLPRGGKAVYLEELP